MRDPVTSGVLVLPPGLTESSRRLAAAATARGLETVQCETFAVPASITSDVRPRYLHAGPTFADAAARVLGIAPLEAPPDWLTMLPRVLTRRDIRAMPIREAQQLRAPAFVKSPNDKSITAKVYADGTRLPGSDAVDPDTRVLVSDVLTYTTEVRLHVLDGQTHTASQYASDGRLDLRPASPDALAFARDLLAHVASTVPSAIVIDIGTDTDGEWSVIEANAAWASGCYAADPDRALDAVLRSAGPIEHLASTDRRFVRGS